MTETETSDLGAAISPSVVSPGRSAFRPLSRRRAYIRFSRVLLSAVTLVLAWWIVSQFYPSYIFPGPAAVWHSYIDALHRGVWSEMLIDTIEHVAVSVAFILIVGLPLGIAIGRSAVVEDLTRVWLIALQTVPTIVLISIALILIGTNTRSVILVTAISGLAYFLINVIQGARAIDPDLVEMARAYGASERTIMRTVVLPSTVPYVLAGSRITLGVAWQITLFGEYLLGSNGVGFQVSTAIKLLDTASVFMWGISIVVLTIVVEYGILRPAEAYLTRHQRRD